MADLARSTALLRCALTAVAMVAASLSVVVGAAEPAAAHDVNYVELRAVEDGSGGSVKVRAKRHGWGVQFTPRYVVGPSDGCYYYVVKVIISAGRDREKQVGPVCTNDDGDLSDDEIRTLYKTRVVDGREGYAITSVELKFCRQRYGPDPCGKSTAVPPQHKSHTTTSRLASTVRLMNVSLDSFMDTRAGEPSPYDWSDDGCSAPDWVPDVWNDRFREPCLRHDFGYRNFGAGETKIQWYDPRDVRRAWVDLRFLADLQSVCDDNDWTGCDTIATAFFQAVRSCGASAFFGEGFNCFGNRLRGLPDTEAPSISTAVLTMQSEGSRNFEYTMSAEDDVDVTQRRVAINGVWRPWTAYNAQGDILLPDNYGSFRVTFQVADAAGNFSAPFEAGQVTRTDPVTVGLVSIDNNGNVRSCGSTEATPCSDIVKRYRSAISSRLLPDTDLLVRAWRKIDGNWVETSTSPLMRFAISQRQLDFGIDHNLLDGLWRFQVQIPRDPEGLTSFASSDYQYLIVDPPDTTPPTITSASLWHGTPSSQFVSYSLGASDNVGVTQMRVIVNGSERSWVDYVPNGTVVLPDGWGNFGIGFQVMDAAGHVSPVHFAGVVTRQAEVALGLNQVDNNGNVRSCGGSEGNPCSDIVKKFRTTISSAISPDADLLFKAWRKIDGSWVETNTSPFMRTAISGRTVITLEITANLLNGIWRFQSQVPVTTATQFAASDYQYLRID